MTALASQRPANDNRPIVMLQPTGDGKALYRTLARVLVRRELLVLNAIPEPIASDDTRAAG